MQTTSFHSHCMLLQNIILYTVIYSSKLSHQYVLKSNRVLELSTTERKLKVSRFKVISALIDPSCKPFRKNNQT